LAAIVDETSPVGLRRAVEWIAHYFRREFGYDFVQYSVDERDEDPGERDDSRDRAFLWANPTTLDGRGTVEAVGACCFRWRDYEDAPPGFALQWVWLHPYCRDRGTLTTAWPDFRERFGDFIVETPLSRAMASFLSTKTDYAGVLARLGITDALDDE
jgi:hypothetical protein